MSNDDETPIEKAARMGGKVSSMSPTQAAANSMTHGLFASPSNLFELASAEEKEWTIANYRSLRREAPFPPDDIHKTQLLWQVSIDMLKIRRGNDYLAKNGLVEERDLRYPDGYPVLDAEMEQVVLTRENRVHQTINRLRRSNLRTLKELGMLNQEADSTESLAVYLSNIRKESDGRSSETRTVEKADAIGLSNLRKEMDEGSL